jgi:hypothetical protein
MVKESNASSLKWFVTIAVFGLVAYQIYAGYFLSKIGIPGVLEFEFSRGAGSDDTVEGILGRN